MIDGLDWGFAFEVKDGPSQEDFGWGVLTHNEAGMSEKPRYYAFAMMKDMAGERLVVAGEGTNVTGWAVRKGEDKYQLIAANYYLQGSEEEVVPVKFEDLSDGQYKLSWQSLSGDTGEELVEVEGGELSKEFVMQEDDVLKVVVEGVEVYKRVGSDLPEGFEEVTGSGFGLLLRGE
jgi:hypothetical protein